MINCNIYKTANSLVIYVDVCVRERDIHSGCVFCNVPQYHSTKLASVFCNVPQSHLYAYTCKIKWDGTGDCGTVVCYKSYEISQSTTVPLVKFARELNSRAFQMVHWKHQYKLKLPISISRMVLWYCGTVGLWYCGTVVWDV